MCCTKIGHTISISLLSEQLNSILRRHLNNHVEVKIEIDVVKIINPLMTTCASIPAEKPIISETVKAS